MPIVRNREVVSKPRKILSLLTDVSVSASWHFEILSGEHAAPEFNDQQPEVSGIYRAKRSISVKGILQCIDDIMLAAIAGDLVRF
jgi:hypothetical protein